MRILRACGQIAAATTEPYAAEAHLPHPQVARATVVATILMGDAIAISMAR